MSGIQDAVIGWIASNEHIAAPVLAFLVAYVLYGVLGKRYLGADDDFWEQVRKRLIPAMDRLVAGTPLYVLRTSDEYEYACYVYFPVESIEEELEAIGYHRNPLASLKTNPEGRTEAGSWAKREGRVGRLGKLLASRLPFGGIGLGRFLGALGEVLATKQTHVTLYTSKTDGTHIYAHREYNSINPFTALLHYRGGGGFDAEAGIEDIRRDLTAHGISWSKTPAE